jgi:hypothetical protein
MEAATFSQYLCSKLALMDEMEVSELTVSRQQEQSQFKMFGNKFYTFQIK